MAKNITTTAERPGISARMQEFFHEIWVEMHKVSWPDKDTVVAQTQVVLLLLVILAAVCYFYDQIFQTFVMILLRILS